MGLVVYFSLCLLGCFLLGVRGTEEEDASDENVAAKSSCSPGAIYVRGNCYEFFRNSMLWDEAEAECQNLRRGSHLASFSNLREEKIVSAYIKRHGSYNHIWIGLNAAPNVNTLVWEWSDRTPYISGSPLWDSRSPSTSLSPLECMLLVNIQSPSSSARWVPTYCSYSYPYLCKYRAYN